MKKHIYLLAALFLCTSLPLRATSFIAPPATGQQTLGVSQSGVVQPNGVISAPSEAVTINGNNATLLNSGLIETTSTGESVYVTTANGVQIVNNGSILSSDDYTVEFSSSSGCQLINNGTISNGEYAVAVGASPNLQIINNGLISSPYAYTIYYESSSTGCQIFNNGTISSEGDLVIYVDGSNNFQLTNSGTIQSVGPGNYCLYVTTSTGQTLSLLRGSNLQGLVYVDTAPLNLNVQTGLNLALTTTGGEPFGNLGISAPYVITGDPAIGVIDPTGLTFQADVAADISDTILNGIYLHRLSPSRCGIWVEGIGSYRKRDGSDDFIQYEDWQGGGLIGYDREVWGHDISFFGGATYLQAQVHNLTQEADVVTVCGGVTYKSCICDTFVGLSAVGAYINWDNRRIVMNNLAPGGVETAKVNMNRGLFAADLTLGRSFTMLCDPYVTFNLRYAGLYLGTYTEQGSLTNLTLKNRSVDLITTRLETTIGYLKCLSCFEPFIGVFGRYQVGGYEIDSELLGSSLSFYQGGPRNLAAFLIGFRAQGGSILNVFLNFEASFDTCNSTRVLAEGGFRF